MLRGLKKKNYGSDRGPSAAVILFESLCALMSQNTFVFGDDGQAVRGTRSGKKYNVSDRGPSAFVILFESF